VKAHWRPVKQTNILFGRLFLIFLEKIKKKGDQTLFYFAAGGGEIRFTKTPHRLPASQKPSGFVSAKYLSLPFIYSYA